MVKIASKRAGILIKRISNPTIDLRIDEADTPVEVTEEVAENLLSEPATKNIIYKYKEKGGKT